ncbi:unnamed protein product, partial [Mesorhabditis spiculigera]
MLRHILLLLLILGLLAAAKVTPNAKGTTKVAVMTKAKVTATSKVTTQKPCSKGYRYCGPKCVSTDLPCSSELSEKLGEGKLISSGKCRPPMIECHGKCTTFNFPCVA